MSLLACPACGAGLRTSSQASSDALACGGCGLDFPRVGRVPWLYRDPVAKLIEWRNLYEVSLAEHRRTEDRLKGAARAIGLGELTKRRLSKELQARVEHRKALESLLEPLARRETEAIELLRVLVGKAAGTQMLSSYAINAIRDWGWSETSENDQALALVRAVLGPAAAFGSMAVLGAGAGRLAYDLHQAKVAQATVTLDINPFLTLVAERITSGKSLSLYEFPLAPAGIDNVALARKLAAPAKTLPGLTVLFGDVMNAPFAVGAFDLVVTPWLIDIIPEAPADFLPRINRLLKPGGVWLNHGSCAFQQGSPERHVSREELFETVGQSGFTLQGSRLDSVPYLSSPASCQARSEIVLTFAATKSRDVPAPAPYQALPPWLLDTAKPLPRTESLGHLAATHAFHAEVLALLDGQRSAQAVTEALAAKYQLEPAALRPAVISFLANMYELTR